MKDFQVMQFDNDIAFSRIDDTKTALNYIVAGSEKKRGTISRYNTLQNGSTLRK